jgi:acyl carrier protein
VALLLPPAFPARELWGNWPEKPEQDPVGIAARRLLELEASAGDRLLVLRDDLADAVAEVRRRFGALDGTFHTPGAFTGGLIQLKTRETLAAALGPVEQGARSLFAALDDGTIPFIVLVSSSLAFTGGLGQIDLAAAGAYMDALAQQERRGVAAAHFDPYQWRAWLAAGLGAMPGLGAAQQQDLEAGAVPIAASGEALRRLLDAGLPRVIVSARDLGAVIEQTDALTAETFLAEMEKLRRSGKAHGRAGIAAEYVEPADGVERRVAELWQELFGIEPIGAADSFLELGGHSLLAIQLVTQLRAVFEVDLPVTIAFEAPTVADLARAVEQARIGEPETEEDLEALLAQVEGLSADEVLQRMEEASA